MGQILRVTKAFSVLSDPSRHVYTPGELVDADHPHVKGRRDTHFGTVKADVSVRTTAHVEQATAAPGERRANVVKAAKKAVTKKAVAPGEDGD